MPQRAFGPASVRVGSDPRPRKNLRQHNVEDLLHRDAVDRARAVTSRLGKGFKTAGQATSAVFSSLGDIIKIGLDKTASKPMWLTGIAGAGGLVAGVKSVKNILTSFSTMVRPMQDPKLGWLPHMFLGILQGGLTLGLTAPFLGRKNLFTEQINGRPAVPVKSLVGVGFGALVVAEVLKLAKGIGTLRKFPVLGPSMQEIAEMGMGAVRSLTVSSEQGQGAPQQPAMAGAPA